MPEHRLTTLESGVRIVTEAMPSVRSASLGFWIGTGSRHESDAEAGLSHLLEHLLFKGSARYASLEIDQIFDAMGAELNAGTGKETTSVFARVIDDHLSDAFDVMADMVFAPRLIDIDSEREVILEEIAMYEDDPQEKVFDLLGEATFGADPLGRAIIGTAAVVSGTPPEEIARFHAARYAPPNVVIAAAGSVDHDALVALTRDRVPPTATAVPAAALPGAVPAVVPGGAPLQAPPGSRRFERKDTEQFHVCLGGVGLSRHDDRRFALRVLDTIFGGTSSSRLFQEIREQRGLAYAVYSFTSGYHDTGQVGLYVGTRADNLEAAMDVVGTELDRARRDPASADELARAKENLKGRVVLALESTGARMNRLGSEVLGGGELPPIEEVIARIDAVTREDVAALASELWAPDRLSAAGIGPDAERFEAAVGGVLPALAEAAPVIRVAVAGAAGRMGETVCGAVQGADDMELVSRADPALGVTLTQALDERPEVLVDFTVPTTALANAREAVAAGVHVVIGTTGFDAAELEGLGGANVFVAPNFAIGAVLMMRFAAQAARHMAKAEIIELHHAGKLDAPSGTAARTATLMQAARDGGDTGPPIPIHSVRLPGLVAHQEVILGDVGQTLTLRHDSIDRESFMPGVLLAVRRVGGLTTSPVVGLEHLLD